MNPPGGSDIYVDAKLTETLLLVPYLIDDFEEEK